MRGEEGVMKGVMKGSNRGRGGGWRCEEGTGGRTREEERE